MKKFTFSQSFLCLLLILTVFSLAQADPFYNDSKLRAPVGRLENGSVNPFYDEFVEGDRSIASDGAHVSGDATWNLSLEMPPDAQVLDAFLYQGWGWLDSPGKREVTFNGTPLSDPYDVLIGHDGSGGSSRWEVTELVTGPGNYVVESKVVEGAKKTWNYGAVLIVIWTQEGADRRRVMINDGCQTLVYSSGSTTFPTIETQPGPASMDVLVFGGETAESDTEIFFNGTSLGTGIISDDNAYTFDVTSLINSTNTTQVSDYGDTIAFEGSVLTVPASDVGAIDGYVTDCQSGKAIRNAFVIAIQRSTIDNTRTNKDGYYEFPDLNPGTWWLISIKDGYTIHLAKVEVKAGYTTTHDFCLEPK